MQKTDQQVVVVIISILILLVFIVLVVLLLAVYYSNSKQKLIREKEILKTTYEQAILQAQFEIQEQTLRNASKEIHDNIGQVLSYISLNLDRASTLEESLKNSVIAESRLLVNQSMNDLRDLSKSFSLDNIVSNGLAETIKAEVIRLNKSRLIDATLNISGTISSVGKHQELVIFRIFQEFINNTLKHARAKNLTINLQYDSDRLSVKLIDNGVGFDLSSDHHNNGSGLKNMHTRAGLIGADITTGSQMGVGSWLNIVLLIYV